MTGAMVPAVPWGQGHSDLYDAAAATVDPVDSAAAAAVAAPEMESPRAPWRGLSRAEQMRWTKSSDASSGSHATTAAGRGSRRSWARRAGKTAGTARNRTGAADGRNSAGSGRWAHAKLGARRKRQGGSGENLRPSWSELLLDAERRLKWVRCGLVSGRHRGAAVEAVADPSRWGRLRGRREFRTGAARWRIIRPTSYKQRLFVARWLMGRRFDPDPATNWRFWREFVLSPGQSFVIACGINTDGGPVPALRQPTVSFESEAGGGSQTGPWVSTVLPSAIFALRVADKRWTRRVYGKLSDEKTQKKDQGRTEKGRKDRHQPNPAR